MRNGKLTTKDELLNLHPTKDTHWFEKKNEKCFDPHVCLPSRSIKSLMLKRNGRIVLSEYKKQRRNSFFVAECKHNFYPIEFLRRFLFLLSFLKYDRQWLEEKKICL